MPRYIDLEELERRIKKYVKPEIPEEKAFVEYYKDECIRQGYAMPFVYVAPRSEIERLTIELEAMRGAANSYKMHYENARKEIERLKDYNTGVAFKHYFDGREEVAREIFSELDEALAYCLNSHPFAIARYNEIKRKYKGDNK